MSNPRFTRHVPSARSELRPAETLEVDDDAVVDVASAVGADTRWKIIRSLASDTRTIGELTDAVDLSKGTVSVHVQKLEEAGVVDSRYNVSDNGGVEKEIALAVDEITLKLSNR